MARSAADAGGDVLLREQWDALRAWLEGSGIVGHAAEPSVLPGWTVHELITHVGRSFLAATLLTPYPRRGGDPVLSLGRYVARYAAAADEIADGTRELARSFSADVLGGVDRAVDVGLRALERQRGDVVVGPRGPLRRSDFVATRLIELVVHGDDLHRSVPGLVAPTHPALDAVVDALVGAYLEAVQHPPEVGPDALAWVRRATGRAPTQDAALPLL